MTATNWRVMPLAGLYIAVTCTEMGTPLILISEAPRIFQSEAEEDGRSCGLPRFTLF